MKIDERGLNLIKKFEGCKLTAYKAVKSEQYYTIGYGHYGSDVKKGMTITKEKAEQLLKVDVSGAVTIVNMKVKVPITQSMFNALVSFCYNCGSGAFSKSTLLKKINLKDYIGASNEFKKWIHSGGMKVAGLVKRRETERIEFLRNGIPEKEKGLPKLKGYKGNSLVDGLKWGGYASNFSYRKNLWEKIGYTDKYTGSSVQNTLLLNRLKTVD